MKLAGRHALVLGAGRSGRAAATLLRRSGARVCIYDRDAAALDELGELGGNIEVVTGDEAPSIDAFDCAVASPGIPVLPHPKLLPEVDLAAIFLRAPLVGVTGTNGKSTTTLLIAEMLRASGKSVAVGGNIGTPLCSLVDAEVDVVVAELSSFQLEYAQRLTAHVAVLLNLAADHLDRHGDLAHYGAAKERLAALQGPDDFLVTNADDAWASAVAKRSVAHQRRFGVQPHAGRSAFCDADAVVFRAEPDSGPDLRVPLPTLSPSCRHPIANSLAAGTAALRAGATFAGVSGALQQFAGLEHRHRLIATRSGVQYIDDSKATNPAAAAASLQGQTRPVWWLAGGRNKNLDFGPLAGAVERVREALLFGEAREELAAALGDSVAVQLFPDLDQAVAYAAERAAPGEVVLLSPACASFDQFASFEARGVHFARVVRDLPC